jgi:hypothetical protein
MTCGHFDEQLWEAAETGNLPAALSNHLAGCARCRKSLEAMRATIRGCHALRTVQAPRMPGIATLLNTAPSRPWIPVRLVAVLATCLALSAVISLYSLSTRRLAQHPAPPVTHRSPVVSIPESKQPVETKAPSPPDTRVVAASGHGNYPARRMARHHRHRLAPQTVVARRTFLSPVAPREESSPNSITPSEMASALDETVQQITPGEDITLETDRIAAVSRLPITYEITPVAGDYESELAQHAPDQVIRILSL